MREGLLAGEKAGGSCSGAEKVKAVLCEVAVEREGSSFRLDRGAPDLGARLHHRLRAKALLLAKQNKFKDAVSWGEKALAAAKAATQAPPPQQVAELETSLADWKKKG